MLYERGKKEKIVHYVFYCKDQLKSLEKRRNVRHEHMQRLEILKKAGRLIIAGAILNEDDNLITSEIQGSLIIADFPNLEAAKAWIAADPYVTAGIYVNITVQPFKMAL